MPASGIFIAMYVQCSYDGDMAEMKIEWDPQKADGNIEKHGVTFEEASTAFSDEFGRLIPDPDHSDEEDRFILLGMSWSLRLLVVCHCYREPSSVIRIISARKATRAERAQYGAVSS
jgi:uncharacterized protein